MCAIRVARTICFSQLAPQIRQGCLRLTEPLSQHAVPLALCSQIAIGRRRRRSCARRGRARLGTRHGIGHRSTGSGRLHVRRGDRPPRLPCTCAGLCWLSRAGCFTRLHAVLKLRVTCVWQHAYVHMRRLGLAEGSVPAPASTSSRLQYQNSSVAEAACVRAERTSCKEGLEAADSSGSRGRSPPWRPELAVVGWAEAAPPTTMKESAVVFPGRR